MGDISHVEESRRLFVMDQGARNWLYRTVRDNLWRVMLWYEFDDLLQDGFLCWAMICLRYPDATDPRHIMRLFQVCFLNYINRQARDRCRRPEVPFDPTSIILHNRPCDISALLIWLAEMPPVLGELVYRMMSGMQLLSEPFRRYPDGTRETLNERLCRIMGLDPEKYDLHGMLFSALKGKTYVSDKSAVFV